MAALGTRSLRRRQPLNEGIVKQQYPTDIHPEKPLNSISLGAEPTSDQSDQSALWRKNSTRKGTDSARILPVLQNGDIGGRRPASKSHVTSEMDNARRNEAPEEISHKAQLNRNLSVRSEICVSPTWSKSGEVRRRRRDQKRQAKEQKELEKKLDREARGKSREPRRLTKAPGGTSSSRASSAHSAFRRFSTSSSIRSFWSNRTSRASSLHDSDEWPKPRRHSISSQIENTLNKYKSINVWTRRAGELKSTDRYSTLDQGGCHPDTPKRTLHTTRKNHDLRGSAQAAEDYSQPVKQSHPQKLKSALSNAVSGPHPRVNGQPKVPTPSQVRPKSDIPSDPDKSTVMGTTQRRSRSRPRKLASNDPEPSTLSIDHPPPRVVTVAARAPQEPPSRPGSSGVDKPGDLSEDSLARDSPLRKFAANAALLLAEKGFPGDSRLEEDKEDAESPQKPSLGSPSVNKLGSKDNFDTEPGKKGYLESPDNTGEQQVQKQPNKPELEVTEPSNISERPPEPAPLPDPSPDDTEKKQEALPKPIIAPLNRDPRFQSSPLAGPPLVVPDPDDNAVPEPEIEVLEGQGENKGPQPRRPGKLRRRSLSSGRSEPSSQVPGSSFPRFWKTSKKEKKGKSVDEKLETGKEKDGGTQPLTSWRRKSMDATKLPDTTGKGTDTSQPNNRAQNNTEKGKDPVNTTAPSLPTRSTARDRPALFRARHSTTDAIQPGRPLLLQNGDISKRPLTSDATSRDILGSTAARRSTGNLTLRDLMKEETFTSTKSAAQKKPEDNQQAISSNTLSTGNPGQKTQRTAFHPGQRVAKMFVICCQCKFWHDMPSDAYTSLVSSRASSTKDPSQLNQGEKGKVSNKPGGPSTEAVGAPPGKASLDGTSADRNSKNPLTQLKEAEKTQQNPTSRSGLTIQTSPNCCWCNHRMTKTCCAGWTAIVNLHERHH